MYNKNPPFEITTSILGIITGAMGNTMSKMNQHMQNVMTPPSIPIVAYHIAENGQAAGPFDI